MSDGVENKLIVLVGWWREGSGQTTERGSKIKDVWQQLGVCVKQYIEGSWKKGLYVVVWYS